MRRQKRCWTRNIVQADIKVSSWILNDLRTLPPYRHLQQPLPSWKDADAWLATAHDALSDRIWIGMTKSQNGFAG